MSILDIPFKEPEGMSQWHISCSIIGAEEGALWHPLPSPSRWK